MYRLIEIRRAVVSLFYPNRCPFCDRIIATGCYWCDECYDRLKFIEDQPETPEFLDGMMSCCYYTGRAKSAVLRMKSGFYAYSCEAFAVMMTELVGELMQHIDIVTAVPSSRGRKAELGYAQAEKIAKDIALRGRKPFKKVLNVSKDKKEQKRLNRHERKENARKSYKIRDNKYILNKTILIVDDVSTTGATLSAIAEMLKREGADKVYAVTFAKTKSRSKEEDKDNDQ